MNQPVPSPLPIERDRESNNEALLSGPAGTGVWPWLYRFVPAIDSLRTYRWGTFRVDLLAGLTVAAVAVPQAMAYAMVAGVDPRYGLYTAIVMTAVGALFDSSKQLINGPTNAIAIAMITALAAFDGPEEKLKAAVLLAMMVGLVQTAITLMRLGDLTRYISHSVIVGFTAGAGLLLVLDQIKNLFGIPGMGDVHDHFLKRLWLTLGNAGNFDMAATLLGLGTIVFVVAVRWLKHRLKMPLLPEFLLAVVLSGFAVWLFKLDDPRRVVGQIPQAVPTFQLPEVHLSRIRELSNSALAIGILGLLEAVAMAKAIAARTGQKLDINQQCLSEGLANLSGSFFQCFPGSGSLTRSAINQQAGAQTQWSGVFSALAVLVIVLAFGSLAAYIPRAALAGILIVSAFRMIDRQQLWYHWQATRFDRGILLATAISAIAISVEFCIIIGVIVSYALYVRRAARLHMGQLVVTPERVIRERVADDPRCGRIFIGNMEGEMFFGSAPDLEAHLELIEKQARDGVRVVVLRLKRVRNPDAVCIHLLDQFLQQMNAAAIPVLLCGVRPEMDKIMRKTGLNDHLGIHKIFSEVEGGEVFSSTLQAVRHAYELLGENVCDSCPRRGEQSREPLYYMI
jgi:SulP family sulfate permease